MIYIDTSVVLARLLAEDRQPDETLWDETLIASRLLEYEMWTRVHARGLAGSHGDAARMITGHISFLELSQPVLARALAPFPVPVRTLDALHLASIMFLKERGHEIFIATFDGRMKKVARAMSLDVVEL